MIVGNGRAGKSTRANQLLRHELESGAPFEALDGCEFVTMQFQYVGPFKFAQLEQIHTVRLDLHTDPDVFIVDCEGLHSFGKTAIVLMQATFALAQIVSLTVLVSKEVNRGNIEQIGSLFVLSHAFTRKLPGFRIGTVIMIPEVGIRLERDAELSPAEMDTLRRKRDAEVRERVINDINTAKLKFSERDSLVLAQPRFKMPDLYWKSIEDLLIFAASVASSRAKISGENLLSLFEEVKPRILAISDFQQASIPIDQIIANMTRQYLKAAVDSTLEKLDSELDKHISKLDDRCLRLGRDLRFVTNLTRTLTQAFEAKADEFWPHLLEYSAIETRNSQQLIASRVQESYKSRFIQKCVQIVLPHLQTEIADKVTEKIEAEGAQIPLPDVGLYSFAGLSTRGENEADSLLRTAAQQIDLELTSRPEFGEAAGFVRGRICDCVNGLERARKHEHAAYVQAESERRQRELQAQFEKDLETMRKEDAEQRRRDQEASDQKLAQLQAGMDRERLAHEEALKAAAEERERHQREIKELEAARLNAEQENASAIEAIKDQWKKADDARAAREREERLERERRDQLVLARLGQVPAPQVPVKPSRGDS
jgi:hypothetical protein